MNLEAKLKQAETVAEWCDEAGTKLAGDVIRGLIAEVRVLLDALWKACGDDEQVVNDTIASQR